MGGNIAPTRKSFRRSSEFEVRRRAEQADARWHIDCSTWHVLQKSDLRS